MHRPSRGSRRFPRLGLCTRPPERDTACENFLASLYYLFHPLKYECAFLGLYCACYRVCLSGHTVYTAPFPHLHAGKHMLAASVVTVDRRK